MMEDTKEMTTEYRMAQWAEKMRERSESGLSIVKYCEREGMPTNRYHYWQRRLRLAAAKEIMSATERTSPVPAGWRQVNVAECKKTGESGVRIEVGKCRVVAEKTTDMELLAKVCKALGSLC